MKDKKIFFFFFYLLFFLLGCDQINEKDKVSNKKKNPENTTFYKDFDFTSLTGRKQIFDTLTFPYIEMSTTKKEIIVKIYGLNDYFQENTFQRAAYGWYSLYKFDKPKEEIYRFYLNTGNVQEISYQINSNGEKYVNRLSFFSKDLKEDYIFSRAEGLYFEFNEKRDYPVEKAKYKDLAKFEKHPNYMKVRTMREDEKTGQILFRDSKCYQLKGFSIFWWYHIGYLLEKVSC